MFKCAAACFERWKELQGPVQGRTQRPHWGPLSQNPPRSRASVNNYCSLSSAGSPHAAAAKQTRRPPAHIWPAGRRAYLQSSNWFSSADKTKAIKLSVLNNDLSIWIMFYRCFYCLIMSKGLTESHETKEQLKNIISSFEEFRAFHIFDELLLFPENWVMACCRDFSNIISEWKINGRIPRRECELF